MKYEIKKLLFQTCIIAVLVTSVQLMYAQKPAEFEGNGDQFVSIKSLTNDWSGIEFFQGSRTRPNWRIHLETPRGDLLFRINETDYFTTPGFTLMRMTSDSLVGIGNQIPVSKLHVSTGFDADLSNHGFLMLGQASLKNMVFDNDEILVRSNGFPSKLILQSQGGETLLQSGGGNVGIGIPTTNSPDARLQIAAGEDVGLLTDGFMMMGVKNNRNLIFDEDEIQARNNGTRSDLFLQPEGGNTGVADNSGQPALASLHVFDGFESNYLGGHGYFMMGEEEGVNISMDREDIMARFGAGPSPLYVQRYGGNVGIGTLNDIPEAKLHIQGGEEALLTDDGYVMLGEANKPNLVIDNKQIQARDDGSTSDLPLQHDGGDVILTPIGTNNRVGIGTEVPEEKVHVQANGWQALFQNKLNTNKWYFGASDTGWAIGTDDQFVISSTGVSSTGLVYLDAGSQSLGIGTPNVPSGYKVAVDGNIICEQVRVELSDVNGSWPDYVFEDSYELQPLEDLSYYLKKHHHLPGIPSAEQVEEEGIDLGDMQRLLLEKIEELTLHVIDLNERNKALEAEIKELKQDYGEKK